ncbi:hypothetical protein N7447_007058 [Penicillium robsamsonii]|uniref:uncharacterized protein n=1 Tax=Penicillium robsamsonii TaxID=1792511 RepID=UPI0025472E31|nr:uncharacterized protein N7447_007058 [Penicillium robsamsonii]KAJ5824718.1 hypothetical protein N7447_007058 [Penicillium robsamsonii]
MTGFLAVIPLSLEEAMYQRDPRHSIDDDYHEDDISRRMATGSDEPNWHNTSTKYPSAIFKDKRASNMKIN